MQEYYDAHDWTVDGVEGKAPLADVKANVKTALRTERYRERVQSKADKIDVSTLPWKRLYAYAATLVADRRAEADPSVAAASFWWFFFAAAIISLMRLS